MAILDITKLRPSYKGEWSSSTTYVAGDVVSYRRALYSATGASTGVLPQSDTSVTPAGSPWALMTLDADTAVLVANNALGDTSQGVLYRDTAGLKLSAGATNKALSGNRVAVRYLTTSAQGANKTWTGATVTPLQNTRIASGISQPNSAFTTGITQTFINTDEEGVEEDLVTFETSTARAGNINNDVQVSRFTTTGGRVNYTVSGSGSPANYAFTGTDLTGTQNDPALSVRVGDRLVFTVSATGNGFYISTVPGASWTLGTAVANTPAGVVNNGTASGTIDWIPQSAGVYYYVSGANPTTMTGTITVSPRSDVRFVPVTQSRFQNFGLTRITDFTYPDGVTCVKPRWMDQDYCFMPVNQYSRGGTSDLTGIGFYVMPDRKSVRVGGFHANGNLPINHWGDWITTATYGLDEANRRLRDMQFAQFLDPLRPDEVILYGTRAGYNISLVTNHGRLFQSGQNTNMFYTDNYYHFFKAHPHFDYEQGRTAVDLQHWQDRNNFSTIAATGQCWGVLTREGELWMWGRGDYGTVGSNTTNSFTWPILPGELNMQRIISGGGTTLNDTTSFSPVRAKVTWFAMSPSIQDGTVYAANDQNELYGWGYNGRGTLGLGDQTQRNVPTRILSLEATLASNSRIPVDISLQHNGSTDTGTVYRCTTNILFGGTNNHIYTAGLTTDGQDGTSNVNATTSILTWAQANRPAGRTWIRMKAAGHQRSTVYALTDNRNLYAWGNNQFGQVGDATTNQRTAPVLMTQLPAGMQGNVFDFYPYGGGDGANSNGYTGVLVRSRTYDSGTNTFTGTADRWAIVGFSAESTTYRGQYAMIPNSGNARSGDYNTDALVIGFEITNLLPRFGQGIVEVNIVQYSTWAVQFNVMYDNGEMFNWGYNFVRGSNGSDGGWAENGYTSFDTFNAYRAAYPRLVNSVTMWT
ncbi:MAG: hypothetical protein EBT80_00025 [Chitinophagales bacterium]|nr:hypothetical protein [Chitinophagales bacterium]